MAMIVPYRTTRPHPWWLEKVETNPDVMGGVPVFRGTRVPVRLIESFLLAGNTPEEIFREYEGRLPEEDIRKVAERVVPYAIMLSVIAASPDTQPPSEFFKKASSEHAFAF